jgi:hypothetical protein
MCVFGFHVNPLSAIKRDFDMAKQPPNHGKDWSQADVKQLRQEIRQNTPTRVLGLHLGRTPEAVQQKANDLGLSLKPTNQRPYGTKK